MLSLSGSNRHWSKDKTPNNRIKTDAEKLPEALRGKVHGRRGLCGALAVVKVWEMPSFEIRTVVRGNVKDLADDLLCMEGVNYELLPLVKMTVPSDWLKKPLKEWPQGSELFTSTILLFGILPVDFHKFRLKSVSESGFNENSSSLVNKKWNHQRTITKNNGDCIVHDRVEYVPKLSLLGGVMRPIYKAIFAHRHKRLKAKYGVSS